MIPYSWKACLDELFKKKNLRHSLTHLHLPVFIALPCIWFTPAYIAVRQCDERIFWMSNPSSSQGLTNHKEWELVFYLLLELSDSVLDIQTANSVMRLTEEFCVGARCVRLKSWWRLELVWVCVCVHASGNFSLDSLQLLQNIKVISCQAG